MTSQINLYKKKDSEKNHVYKVVVGRMNGRQAFFKSQANIEKEEIMNKKNIKAKKIQEQLEESKHVTEKEKIRVYLDEINEETRKKHK